MPPRRPPPLQGQDAREARSEAAGRVREAMIGDDESLSDTVQRLGGARAVAGLVGRSVRQVQRWARGETRAPRSDAASLLRGADVRDRLNRRGFSVDPGGQPSQAVRIQTRGQVSVQGPSNTEVYTYVRRIGAEGGHELRPDTFATMVDRLTRGDEEGALQAYEQQMTGDYVSMSEADYDAARGIGFRQDTIDDVSLYTDGGGGRTPLF